MPLVFCCLYKSSLQLASCTNLINLFSKQISVNLCSTGSAVGRVVMPNRLSAKYKRDVISYYLPSKSLKVWYVYSYMITIIVVKLPLYNKHQYYY